MPDAAKGRTGKLTVTISGLPSGLAPRATLRGPGVNRRIRGRSVRLAKAKPGRYTVVLERVRVRRASGTVKSGATVYPFARRTTVRVRRGKAARATPAYGTIVNPGLRTIDAPVLTVGGPADAPTSLILGGRHAFTSGDVLALPASAQLPLGVLERVTEVFQGDQNTAVQLSPVSVYDVMPVARFDVPLAAPATEARIARAAANCGPTLAAASGVYRKVANPRFSGSWNTVSVFGKKIPVGVNLALDFDLTLGFKHEVGAEVGVSCDLEVPVNGVVLGIPVTGAVFGNLHASLGAGAGYKVDVSTHVRAGASTVGIPPALVWLPEVSVGRPSFSSSWTAEAAVTAGVGAGVKFGLGNSALARATLNFGNDLDVEARTGSPGGSCSVAAKFASFYAEGKVGAWTVESPRTPPLYTRTLLGPVSCGFPSPSGGSGGGGDGSGAGGGGGGGTGGGGTGGGGGGGTGGGGGGGTGPATVRLAQGPAAPAGFRYAITLSGFPANAAVTVNCRDSKDPGGFYTFTMTTDGAGNAFTQSQCYSADGPDHWVIASGVESNHVQWGGGGGGTTPPPPARSVTLARGPAAPFGYRYAITLNNFPPNSGVSVSCRDSVDPGGFYTFTMTTNGAGGAFTQNQCYSGDHPDHWVVAGGVESNHVQW